jgi:Ca-activated chloride channel homolog
MCQLIRVILLLITIGSLHLWATTPIYTNNPLLAGDQSQITQGCVAYNHKNQTYHLPLLHTQVHAKITGLLARVHVTQTFVNANAIPIEAEYLFPLGEQSAIDSMEFILSDKIIRGVVKSRVQAEKEYQHARQQGQRATVLHQSRNNLFRQKLANILPGDTLRVRISYLEPVDFDEHTLRFHFPMTVGPYFNNHQVQDAKEITTTYLEPLSPSSPKVSLQVDILKTKGMGSISSPSHRISVSGLGKEKSIHIRLAQEDKIPNRDFMLHIPFTNSQPMSQLLLEQRQGEYFYHYTLYPPVIPPQHNHSRELIFVVDVSGSMVGFPLNKAREVLNTLLQNLQEQDHFNIILFESTEMVFREQSVPANAKNIALAKQFFSQRVGGGSTNFMAAIDQLFPPNSQAQPTTDKQKTVLFLTDGYIGNEQVIVTNIRDRAHATRVYTLGVGNSVNHSLLRSMAQVGGGYYSVIRTDGDATKATKDFYARLQAPVLTSLQLTSDLWQQQEQYPRRIPYLTSGRPVQISGKLDPQFLQRVQLQQQSDGILSKEFMAVAAQPNGTQWTDFPQIYLVHNMGLASLWARKKINHLELYHTTTSEHQLQENSGLQAQIEALGIKYQVMSRYTSFLAVEHNITNPGGVMKTIEQPAVAPEHVTVVTRLVLPRKSASIGSGRGKGSPSAPVAVGAYNPMQNTKLADDIDKILSIKPNSFRTQKSGRSKRKNNYLGSGGLLGGGGGAITRNQASVVYSKRDMQLEPNSAHSLEQIARVFRIRVQGLRHTYHKHIKTNGNFEGRVTITMQINANGEVVGIQVVHSSTNQSSFDKAIVALIQKWRFNKVKEGSSIVTISLNFSL